jgi:fatty-acyl-CoA synthase
MPVPVLHRLRERLPNVGFYNRFGQSDIGLLGWVLRAKEHAAAAVRHRQPTRRPSP